MKRYTVNGEELCHIGHDGIRKVYFFTKSEGSQNKLVEIPYDFDKIILENQVTV